MRRAMALVCAAGTFLGCQQSPPPPPAANPNGGVNVTAPGVNVRVDPQQGVDVQAPGVDVEVKPEGNPDK